MKTRNLLLIPLLFISLSVKAEMNLPDAQAMFIYNFIRNTHWVENPNESHYIIGIAGNSEVYRSLIEFTRDREIGGKKIKVVRCQNCEDILKCHVLFVPKSHYERLNEISGKLKNKSCLTIFDNCGGTSQSNAAIDFVLENGRLKYRVNHNILETSNYKLSSILVNMSI
jgi:hypothetical protein